MPGLVLMTWWVVIIPAIVLENRSAGESFGRSRDLVRGYGWNVFGVIVLTILLLIVFSIVLSLILSPRRMVGEPALERDQWDGRGPLHRSRLDASVSGCATRRSRCSSHSRRRRLPRPKLVPLDPETQERIDEPVSEEAERETRLTPSEAVAQMRINVPARGNRKLTTLLERVNTDEQLKVGGTSRT